MKHRLLISLIVVTLPSLSLMACKGGSKNSVLPATPLLPVDTKFDTALARQTGSQWVLAWEDEFNGSALDKSRWTYEVNCAGGGNNELQCYQQADQNALVSDGVLAITARAEKTTGNADWDGVSGPQVQRDYSSARLNTKMKGDWKYGRIEVRARLPKGKGIWPAIWMLPTESRYGSWPLSGEIDIMEAINLSVTGVGSNRLYGTLHYGDAPPNNKSTQVFKDPTFDLTADFHTYAIEWQKGEIRWYVDNIYYGAADENTWFTNGTTANGTATSAAPFDQAFHVIINLAVGGNWPGTPDNSTEFPQTLAVDFVRIYSCNAKNAEGWGCTTLEGKEPVYGP